MADTTHVKLTAAKTEAKTTLKEMRALLMGDISRLPVVDATGAPKYVVHDSSIHRYLAGGGKETDSLADLIAQLPDKAVFGPRRGFALAAPNDAIAVAKTKMEAVPTCLDIFVTTDGGEGQPLLGWISNVRLGKYLRP
jgi:hypothetical protein